MKSVAEKEFGIGSFESFEELKIGRVDKNFKKNEKWKKPCEMFV